MENNLEGKNKELFTEWLNNYDDYEITKKVYNLIDYNETKELLESCGIPVNKRAEELNIDDYIRILERGHTL